jgi:hypothetical protein
MVISEATHRMVSGFFETLDLGEVPEKGRAPARAFEVLRPRGRRARLDVAIERDLTPLIGRERELATLLDRFQEAKARRGQVVFIAGEAGTGGPYPLYIDTPKTDAQNSCTALRLSR